MSCFLRLFAALITLSPLAAFSQEDSPGIADRIDGALKGVADAAAAEPAAAGGHRIATTLRALAEASGLSLLEAHRVLHQLIDRKLLRLVDEGLVVPDLDALSGSLEASAS